MRDSRLPEVRIPGVIIFGGKIDHMSSCLWRRVRSGSTRSKMSLFRKFNLPKLSKSKAVSGNYINSSIQRLSVKERIGQGAFSDVYTTDCRFQRHEEKHPSPVESQFHDFKDKQQN